MITPVLLHALRDLRAETYAPRPAQRSLIRILKTYEPRMQRAFMRAVGQAVNGTSQPRIVEALRRGNIDDAIDAVQWDQVATPIIKADLLGEFQRAFEASGISAAGAITAKLRGKGQSRFSIVDDRPLEFLKQHGARLVDDFGLQNRNGLRRALVTINESGTPATTAARQLVQHVGLSEPFSIAVANRRASMIADGVAADAIEREVTRYSKELLNLRTLNIARTEAQIAYGHAHIEAMKQSADQGLLDTDKATKTWRTAGDDVVRDSHAELEGDTIAWDDTWDVDGETVDGPPAGVNCRCVMDVNPLG